MEEQTRTAAFAEYLQSIASLEELENISQVLNRELEDSRKMMAQVRSTFDSISCIAQNTMPVNIGLQQDEISRFLETGFPQLMMPDMAVSKLSDVELDEIIQSMKVYAEELKKKITTIPPTPSPAGEMQNLELDQYATSLDQLNKRVANIKLNKKDELNKRSPELEEKLEKLCTNVNMFTQIIQAKTKISESNKNWTETPQAYSELQYDEVFNRVVSGINEVTYLMQNRN